MKIEKSPTVPLVTNVAGYTMEFLVNVGFVLLMVFFILLSREDMRNRIIGVCGQGNLMATTRALDEASNRVSRFLSMQFLVNASYGVILGIGLAIIGVPFAIIWGIPGGPVALHPLPWPLAGGHFSANHHFRRAARMGPDDRRFRPHSGHRADQQ